MARANELVLILMPCHRASQMRANGQQNLERSTARPADKHRLIRNYFSPSITLYQRDSFCYRSLEILELGDLANLRPLIGSAARYYGIKDVAKHRSSDNG